MIFFFIFFCIFLLTDRAFCTTIIIYLVGPAEESVMANFELANDILKDIDHIRNQLDTLEYKVNKTFALDNGKEYKSDQPVLSEKDYEFYMQLELDKGWNIDTSYQMKFNFDSKDKDFNSNDVGC